MSDPDLSRGSPNDNQGLMSKEELLGALDIIEKQLGTLIVEASGTFVTDHGVEPFSLQQARIRYGEGSLWLRHWIDRDDA